MVRFLLLPDLESAHIFNPERFCAFVVLQDELNTTDQRHLEYAISENGVNVRRLSMHDIKKVLRCNSMERRFGNQSVSTVRSGAF